MNAKHGTLLIAEQIAGLLASLSQTVYTTPLAIFHGSTIGQHLRHVLEFYTCLLEGIPATTVDYGSRRRDHTIQESPVAALAVLEYVAQTVKCTDEHRLLDVRSEFSDEQRGPVYRSTVGRELQYAFDHAVHHLALIRIGIEANFPDLPVDPDLGVAPSTLRYRRDKSAAAEQPVLSETCYG